MSSVEVRRYTSGDEKTWNEFIARSRNATFLFNRQYMDYHADRFKDHSLLIYVRDVLCAVFVANENGNKIESHGGLTYGGLVLKPDTRMEEVLLFFYHVVKYYSASFSSILYKCLPSYFLSSPSNEDLYALFLLEASLIRRDVSSVVEREHSVPYRRDRKSALKRSLRIEYSIRRSEDPTVFWKDVLVPNLDRRFGVKPVHSISEIKLLMSRFPDNIHLYELRAEKVEAGAVVYLMNDTVHTQYFSATEEARDNGLMDALIDHLVNETFQSRCKFSFGISNQSEGKILNRGLYNWKEAFGARAYVHDFYEIDTSAYRFLQPYDV